MDIAGYFDTDTCLPNYTASFSKRLSSLYSLLWESEISHWCSSHLCCYCEWSLMSGIIGFHIWGNSSMATVRGTLQIVLCLLP